MEHPLVATLGRNIAVLLTDTAERHPDAPAVVDGPSVVTYQELLSRASGIRQQLESHGVREGDRVAIWLDRGADAAAGFFATAALGGVAIMANETLRPRQIQHILGHSSAAALLTEEAVLRRQPRPPASAAQVVDVAAAPTMGPGSALDPVPRMNGDPVQIIYTSGSTGLPKGVTVSNGSLHAGTASVSSYVGIKGADRIASILPFSFDYGFNQLMCAVANGAALVVERSPLPNRIAATIREAEVTVLPCVPPLWLQLLTAPDFARPLPRLRAMTNTGGRLPVEAVRKLRTWHPQARLFLMYGLTEAFRGTYLDPSEVDRRPDSIGKAIPGCEILVIREDGTECEPGEPGELVQRGDTVALGYWADEEATAKVYRPHPLRPPGTPGAERVVYSGDLVRRDEEGFLYFVSRRDRLIKTLGFRVSPDEVVDALHGSAQIAEAVITTEPDDARGDAIIAHVVLAHDGTLDALKAFCREELPRYMQPVRIEVHESLPRTSSGKHDTRALQAAGAEE